ncbi:hypothetical protein GZH47_16875 [Paenibacillus rhizovicinus]|uniref:NHLP leader peptide family natural product n=1 Tax=Paenibacillus rhizovicinus TaxID=2704463 RepID=A0A6C0P1G1_9BACL|nr:hypothetical protein [Paenibacillus rhizovicinus]QHW32315.1 hypothetical protein GZH47_16875 [Paenibacillus rhizovicinus]
MSWTKEAVEEAVRKVGARAATDLEFRSLCVSNIHAAIQQESGIEVPASFTIGVLDQSANQLNIILPPVAREADELLESELESVAGGSKAGANDFFSGVGSGALAMFGEDTGFRGNSSEATAGAAIGAILMLPAALAQ